MRFWRPKGNGQGTVDGQREPAGQGGSGPAGTAAGVPGSGSAATRGSGAPPARPVPTTRGVTTPPPAGAAAPGVIGVNGFGATRLSREVRQLLGSLGCTRGEVAAVLERARVRAAPHEPGSNPVNLFLQAVIGADPNVKSVSVHGTTVVVDMRAWWRPPVVVDLPPVVAEFTAAFDERCYPALLLPDDRTE